MALAYPPPAIAVDPARLVVETLRPGQDLFRIYDPRSRYRPGPRTFRHNGPRERFDHQRGGAGPARSTPPAYDPERGIYYAAFDLEGAIVEVFGDPPGVIERGTFRLVRSSLWKGLRVLDLRGRGGMVAGPTAGISGTETRALTQAWARYFYDRVDIYGTIDGLIYANSHNLLDAVALFERARPAIARPMQTVTRLAALKLEVELLTIADRNNLTLI